MLLSKYTIFPLFWPTLISFFCLNYVKPFLSTVNKCTIIMNNLVQTKEKAQKGHLFPGATKTNLKNLKTYLWMTWCKQQSEYVNFIVTWDLNLCQILAKVLFKYALSGLRQFSSTESLLKWWKIFFISL